MRAISAVNSKGVRIIGVGRTFREAGVATIAGMARLELEPCEREDLASMVSCLAFLEELGAVQDNGRTSGEFWNARIQTF